MDRLTFRRELVYGPVHRLIHAWNGLLILLLIVSGQLASFLEFDWPAAGLARLHLWLGYGLVLGLVARVIWGLVGPAHARWSALWHPEVWRLALAKRQFFTPPGRAGHHPLASAVYLVTYLLLGVMVTTGLALAAIDQNTGPLYAWLGHDVFSKGTHRTPHEWLQYFFIGFVVAHFAALILHERRHDVPVAQAMVSGYQYEKETL